MEVTLVSASPEETYELAKKMGQRLSGGEVLCLHGELGAGKTVFAKGLAKGLGVRGEITSPTFTLIQEYTSISRPSLKFVHMDLYRLKYPEEAEVIGVFDYFQKDIICLIEWPELIVDLIPAERLAITIIGSGEDPRSITLETLDEELVGYLINSSQHKK